MHIHFIGIGGIGVSALAKYYLSKGHKVSGSDFVCSEITKSLEKRGAKILIGRQKKENLPKNADLLIYSPAVPKTNPELKEAFKIQKLKSKIRIMSYPQALGELTKKYFTLAVSGTHGKSTTASMLGLLLAKSGLDPTVIVGTKLKEFKNSNCRVGKSKYLVVEADEHFASFLNYWPRIIVLTNIEADHLDYYKNLENLRTAFKKYVLRLPKNGCLIANKDDKNIRKTFSSFPLRAEKLLWYSLKDKESLKLKKILKIPGEFNVSNALAALAAARTLKIPDKESFKALSKYRGAWRRFEEGKAALKGKTFTLVSDYGHHPTEIKVTLKAAREKYPGKKIWCLFQPHQYQRTHYLFDHFVKTLKQAPIDKIIITDIYEVAGREEKSIKKKVSSEKMAKATKKESVVFVTKGKILSYLEKNAPRFEVLIIMGAGDIYNLAKTLQKS